MVRGALGGSIAPDAPDATDDILLCRVDVLSLRVKREPLLAGRGPVVPRPAPTPTPVPAPRPSFMASMGRFSPTMLCLPGGAGKRFLKSSDADAMLLWRSSKLGEGRNSKVPVEFSFVGTVAVPKEKREWLLRVDALSVGSLPDVTCGLAVGL